MSDLEHRIVERDKNDAVCSCGHYMQTYGNESILRAFGQHLRDINAIGDDDE